MLERSLEWSTVSLIFQVVVDHSRPVKRDQNTRHLVFLGKLVQCQRDDLFLTVTVEQDLFAEAGIPQTSDNSPQVCQEGVFGDHYSAGHAQVVVRMRAIPDRLCHRAAHLQGHLLSHAGHQKGVLSERLPRTVALGTAHRNDDQIILLEPGVDLGHVHGLVVHAAWALHVTAVWELPFTHIYLLLLAKINNNPVRQPVDADRLIAAAIVWLRDNTC